MNFCWGRLSFSRRRRRRSHSRSRSRSPRRRERTTRGERSRDSHRDTRRERERERTRSPSRSRSASPARSASRSRSGSPAAEFSDKEEEQGGGQSRSASPNWVVRHWEIVPSNVANWSVRKVHIVQTYFKKEKKTFYLHKRFRTWVFLELLSVMLFKYCVGELFVWGVENTALISNPTRQYAEKRTHKLKFC